VRLPAVATLLHKNIQAKVESNCWNWHDVLFSNFGHLSNCKIFALSISIEILLKEKREKKKASTSGGVAGCKEATQ
jgi:hypothetical protein